MLHDVLPAINAELARRRTSEGAVVPPAIDLSTCGSDIPPADSFIGRYCDGGLMFSGELDAQIAAALLACWAQQCGHGTGADAADQYASDAIANYQALWEDNCVGVPHCLFYGTDPGCGTCAMTSDCPNVTHDITLP